MDNHQSSSSTTTKTTTTVVARKSLRISEPEAIIKAREKAFAIDAEERRRMRIVGQSAAVKRAIAMQPIYERLINAGIPLRLADDLYAHVTSRYPSIGEQIKTGLLQEFGVNTIREGCDVVRALEQEGIKVTGWAEHHNPECPYKSHWCCSYSVGALVVCMDKKIEDAMSLLNLE
jgi:hypothetical protein